jgi:septal ring factor EnvC (AmiA/AmiB activator)
MPRPRAHTRFETQLVRETDNLKTAILNLRHELANKERYAGRLQYLVRTRSERISELTGKIEQLRTQNQRLDSECERLAEMVRLSTPMFPAATMDTTE